MNFIGLHIPLVLVPLHRVAAGLYRAHFSIQTDLVAVVDIRHAGKQIESHGHTLIDLLAVDLLVVVKAGCVVRVVEIHAKVAGKVAACIHCFLQGRSQSIGIIGVVSLWSMAPGRSEEAVTFPHPGAKGSATAKVVHCGVPHIPFQVL